MRVVAVGRKAVRMRTAVAGNEIRSRSGICHQRGGKRPLGRENSAAGVGENELCDIHSGAVLRREAKGDARLLIIIRRSVRGGN